MPVRNDEIAALFREMADLLELDDANPFRVRAYRNAAVTLEELRRPISELIDEGSDLTTLRGIGDDLAVALQEINDSGRFSALDELRGEATSSLRDLMQVPGLGPKRVQALHEELGIATLDDLASALDNGDIEKVSGFGKKTAQNLRETIVAGRRKKQRRLWVEVESDARALEEFVLGLDGVEAACVGGSFRRQRESVADLDIVAASSTAADVIEQFLGYGEIGRVASRGSTRASVQLKSGLPVDLRVVEPDSYGSALLYFTGSRDHQIRLRDLAIERGWKLNEYGLFDGDERIAGETEEDVYRRFDLHYIAPEIRESRGEIEAARNGKLPKLVQLDDIRGDTHVSASFGSTPLDIRTLAHAGADRGYDYLVVVDRVRPNDGDNTLTVSQMRVQIQEIALINEEIENLTLLAGVEIEILEDGSLAIDPGDLGEFDLLIGAIDNGYGLSRAKQTSRLVRAIEETDCQLISHLTGRLVGERDPIDFDPQNVFTAARDKDCAIEVDGNPRHLDIPDLYCQAARDSGAKLVLASHATTISDLSHIRLAVGQARRGWIEADDVLNALPLDGFLNALRNRG